MKIVYVVGGLLRPNGMSQVLSQKINWLAKHTDHELYMILTERKGEPWYYEISEKVRWVNFDLNFDELDTMPPLKKIYFYKKKQRRYRKLFTDYLMEVRPDITVSACRREINFLCDIKDGSRKIGEFHFNRDSYRKIDKRFFPRWLNETISRRWIGSLIKQLKRLDAFVVLSHEDRQAWVEMDDVKVIHNPVKLLPTEFSDTTAKRVIAVGSYNEVKGYDMLFDAWKKVCERHPDWRLDVFGSGDNALYQQLANDKVAKGATCHPAEKDIYKQYRNSGIFVLTSRHEGFGLVIAEAMSCGLPAVSFACPCGPRDIITDGDDGILVECFDTDALADAICRLIEHPDERKSMGEKAKISARRFSEDEILKQWTQLFDEVMTKR